MANTKKMVTLEGFDELEKSLSMLEKKFPYTAEQVLQKEARNIRKQIMDSYTANINKGNSIKRKQEKAKQENRVLLEKSFSVGKVMVKKGKITTAVTSRAPHYHLVEDGHELYSHGKYVGTVEGKKIVAKIMGRRSRDSDKIGQKVLDEILKEAGLD